MNLVHLCAGILERDGAILLVGTRYVNHDEPLWNLPGGRQEPGELLDAAVRREFLEEVALDVFVENVAYVSESFDRSTDTKFLSVIFNVRSSGEEVPDHRDERIVGARWVPRAELGEQLSVRVIREPLLAYLGGDMRRYYGFSEAGISIVFSDP